MYKRVLVAVDRRGLADHALPAVAALARQSLGEVLVVSQPDTAETPEAASSRVRDVVRRLEAAGARLIGQAARDEGADLVALGSRGRGDLAGLFLGSVGHQVAAQVGCPVLLVRGVEHQAAGGVQALPIRRLLVAVGGSDQAEGAVAAARTLALQHGAAVLVVHALEPAFEGEDAWCTETESHAEALVRRAAQQLGEPGVTVETRVLPGGLSVAADLAAVAEEWDADLIVLGSRRPTDLGGLLLGSVAHGLVRRTRRPVLLAERARVEAEGGRP